MKDWELYEGQIFDKLRSDFPDSLITKDDRIVGQFSKVPRQVDVSIIGKMAGYRMLGIVECKCFSKRVDVKVIDGFIGFLEDVNANLGVIITNEGFSKAARNRAKVKDIRLEVVEFEHLYDYDLSWHKCQICDPGPDKPPPLLEFDSPYGILYDDATIGIVRVGHCTWCGSTHIECQACGAITAVWECDYNEALECQGGCGLRFRVVVGRPREGFQECIEILPSSPQLLEDET